MSLRAIRAAQPGDKLDDEVVPGLQLLAYATGRKSFLLYYRTKARQQRKPKIGDFGVITLEQARERARVILGKVRAGEDPKANWDEQADVGTVADLWKRFLADYAVGHKSAKEQERMWKVYISPTAFSKLRLPAVAHEDVAALHKRITEKNGPHQANRVLQMVSSMFSKAEVWRDGTGQVMRALGTNPCQHVARNPEQMRRRYATAEETLKIIEQLQRHERRYPAGVAFIKLLIHTGGRSQDIRIARWEWVKGDWIDYPTGSTKTDGATTVGLHRVFLSPSAKAVLESLPRTSSTLTGILSPKNLWDSIRNEAGCPDLHLHDLRHSFASVGLSDGMSLEVLGRLLNHKSVVTAGRYAHLITDKAVEAVTQIDLARQAMLDTARKKP